MEIDPSLRITGEGPPIGTYRERAIPEWIDKAGARFAYDRIAVEDDGGGVPFVAVASR